MCENQFWKRPKIVLPKSIDEVNVLPYVELIHNFVSSVEPIHKSFSSDKGTTSTATPLFLTYSRKEKKERQWAPFNPSNARPWTDLGPR